MAGVSKLISGLCLRDFTTVLAIARGVVPSRVLRNHVEQNFTRALSVTSSSRNQLQLPEKPKRPGNAYTLFVKDKYEEISKQYADTPISNIFKVMGTMWNNLNSQQKEQYEKARELEVTKYKNSLEKFMQSLTETQAQQLSNQEKKDRADRQKRKNKRLSKSLGKPEKPPMSGYTIFIKKSAQAETLTSKEDVQEFVKAQSHKWNNMSDSEKKPYMDEAAKNKRAYDPLLEAWENVMLDQGKGQLVRAKIIAKATRDTANISTKSKIKSKKSAVEK